MQKNAADGNRRKRYVHLEVIRGHCTLQMRFWTVDQVKSEGARRLLKNEALVAEVCVVASAGEVVAFVVGVIDDTRGSAPTEVL